MKKGFKKLKILTEGNIEKLNSFLFSGKIILFDFNEDVRNLMKIIHDMEIVFGISVTRRFLISNNIELENLNYYISNVFLPFSETPDIYESIENNIKWMLSRNNEGIYYGFKVITKVSYFQEDLVNKFLNTIAPVVYVKSKEDRKYLNDCEDYIILKLSDIGNGSVRVFKESVKNKKRRIK